MNRIRREVLNGLFVDQLKLTLKRGIKYCASSSMLRISRGMLGGSPSCQNSVRAPKKEQ